MKKIYKYKISPVNSAFKMHKNAKLLCLKMQQGTPCLWALIDTDETYELRKFVIFGTGHEVVNAGKYVGTFLTENDSLVFHVFEAKEE